MKKLPKPIKVPPVWIIQAGQGLPTLYGPFQTPNAAAQWATDNLTGGVWSIRRLVAPQ